MHGVMTQLLLCKTARVSPADQFHPVYSGLLAFPHTASIFLESPGRIEEIMLWVMPRFLGQMWNFLKKVKIVPGDLPFFINMIFGFTIGILVEYYVNDRGSLKSKYKTIGSL